MKCPLLHRGWVSGGKERMTGFDDCLKEECAWWDKSAEVCCIKLIAGFLGLIGAVMHEIKEKMPHKGQFLEK